MKHPPLPPGSPTRTQLQPWFTLALLLWWGGGGVAQTLDPQATSWFTRDSGKYARIYETSADAAAGNSVVTWSRGQVSQSSPAYAGVQAVYTATDHVYIRTTGLGFHVMGPWYLDASRTQLFPGVPGNTATLWRFPRQPVPASPVTLTTMGSIGYFVDGVAMFDPQDGYYWNGTSETSGMGTSGLWNRDAYPVEGVSFDPANAHQPGSGQYHYHATPPALRWLLGDNVNYNATTKTWSEGDTSAPAKHSPLLGWVKDGYPIYGPYGYSSATDTNSGVRRMLRGYAPRNGQSGTDNLATAGRTTLAAWAARFKNRSTTLSAGEYGPNVSTTYPIGRYHEDYEYLGDVGGVPGVDFDLDQHNGRFCITPEFPAGTYAYFLSIDAVGTPIFPYTIGRAFYGITTGAGVATSLPSTVTTNFVGGPNMALNVSQPVLNTSTLTLTWSAVEGGTYTVERRTAVNGTWEPAVTDVTPVNLLGTSDLTTSASQSFYRIARTALASYSTASASSEGGGGGGGGGTTNVGPAITIASVSPNSGTAGASATVTVTLSGGTNLPPASAVPTSVTLGSATGSGITYNGTAVTATFTLPSTTGLQNIVIAFPAPPMGGTGPTVTGTNVFTVNGAGGGGGTTSTVAPGGTALRDSTVVVTITLTDANLPPLTNPMTGTTILPSSVTLAGITGMSLSRPAQGSVVATFAIPANAPTGAQNVVVNFPSPMGTVTFTLTGGVTIQ